MEPKEPPGMVEHAVEKDLHIHRPFPSLFMLAILPALFDRIRIVRSRHIARLVGRREEN